ncbi:MAG: DUF4012 domain-containing protein [Actinomycetota bacterium]
MHTDTEPRGYSGIVGVIAITLALLGTVLWLSILLGPWRLASGLLDARDHLKRSQKSIAGGATKVARYETLAAEGAVERAREGLERGGPAFDLLSSIPAARDVLGEAEHLVAAAEHSAKAAVGTLDIAQNALKGPDKLIVKDPDDKTQSQIRIERVAELEGIIARVRGEVRASERELREVELAKLPMRLQRSVKDGIDTAREADALLADAQAGFKILPAVLGADEPRTYILGFQNSAEQRGTGGAMLRFGFLSIAEGKPNLQTKTSTVYDVDKNREQISIPLPDDAWYVAGIPDAQRFGNANWSPDWPLSADLTLDYLEATPTARGLPEIDGFFLLDPLVMQELLPGTGPYRIKAGSRISQRTAVHFLLYRAYAKEPVVAAKRRILLNQVVKGFEERMLDPLHPTELVQGLGTALTEKHMQVWMADPAEQRFIERMDWDAGIRDAANKDYLYVVQQNVSGSKLDSFATQTTTMDVAFEGDDARVSTEMKLHNGVFLPQPRYAMGDAQRPAACALARCPAHRPMLNLYVPRDASFIGVEVDGQRIDTPPPAAWPAPDRPPEHLERGKKVWSGTLVVPPDEEGSMTVDYRVPGVLRTVDDRRVYHLVVQHQPKVRPETLHVRLRLPEGAAAVKARGWKQIGDLLVWEKPLTEDLDLEVSWRE